MASNNQIELNKIIEALDSNSELYKIILTDHGKTLKAMGVQYCLIESKIDLIVKLLRDKDP